MAISIERSVRRAALGDEAILRELRLEALCEAPDAFGSTYEREVARTTADWGRWMSPGVTFILSEAAGACGMVAGLRDETDPAVVHLMAMWVRPQIRGSGGADELVAAVVAWAESVGAKLVRLKVIQGMIVLDISTSEWALVPPGRRKFASVTAWLRSRWNGAPRRADSRGADCESG